MNLSVRFIRCFLFLQERALRAAETAREPNHLVCMPGTRCITINHPWIESSPSLDVSFERPRLYPSQHHIYAHFRRLCFLADTSWIIFAAVIKLNDPDSSLVLSVRAGRFLLRVDGYICPVYAIPWARIPTTISQTCISYVPEYWVCTPPIHRGSAS